MAKYFKIYPKLQTIPTVIQKVHKPMQSIEISPVGFITPPLPIGISPQDFCLTHRSRVQSPTRIYPEP